VIYLGEGLIVLTAGRLVKNCCILCYKRVSWTQNVWKIWG